LTDRDRIGQIWPILCQRFKVVWNFQKKKPNDKIRNPIQGEFFSTDGIAGPAQALVRESFRILIDAMTTGAGKVTTRVTQAIGFRAASAASVSKLFDVAYREYAAPGTRLRTHPTPADAYS
jgi:hypothetical protein